MSPSAPVRRSSLRVLVVDDTPAVRMLLVRQLRACGHAVVGEATSAAEAVMLAATLVPEVVVLDLHLPDGLDTDAAARITGGATPGGRTPAVVLCTADDFAEVAEVAGVYAVLPKSVPAALLGSTVRLAAARAHELAAARATAAAA